MFKSVIQLVVLIILLASNNAFAVGDISKINKVIQDMKTRNFKNIFMNNKIFVSQFNAVQANTPKFKLDNELNALFDREADNFNKSGFGIFFTKDCKYKILDVMKEDNYSYKKSKYADNTKFYYKIYVELKYDDELLPPTINKGGYNIRRKVSRAVVSFYLDDKYKRGHSNTDNNLALMEDETRYFPIMKLAITGLSYKRNTDSHTITALINGGAVGDNGGNRIEQYGSLMLSIIKDGEEVNIASFDRAISKDYYYNNAYNSGYYLDSNQSENNQTAFIKILDRDAKWPEDILPPYVLRLTVNDFDNQTSTAQITINVAK